MYKAVLLYITVIFHLNHVWGLDEDELDRVEKHPAWKRLPSDCGLTRFDRLSKRIIMGEEAKLGQFPWMAQLGVGNKRQQHLEPIFICGGAIISQYHILTAAHCGVEKLNVVRVGEHDVDSKIDCQEGVCAPPPQDIYIKDSIFFDYIETTQKGDIGFYILSKRIQFNDFVQPICLPRGNLLTKSYVGRTVQMAGWGVTNVTTEDLASVLMYINAPIVSVDKCNAIYKNKLDDSQLCAGFSSGKDSCSGDSGGPISRSERLNNARRHVILGVVSFGKVNCGTGVAVYTSVPFYMPWILDEISSKGYSP